MRAKTYAYTCDIQKESKTKIRELTKIARKIRKSKKIKLSGGKPMDKGKKNFKTLASETIILNCMYDQLIEKD